MNSKVLIKHSPNGINVVLDHTISFADLQLEVASHFKESASFFGKCSLAVTFTGRVLTTEEEDILCRIIEDHSQIRILCVFVEDKIRDSVFVRAQKIMEDQAVLRAAMSMAPKRQNKVSEFLTYPGSIPEGEVCKTAHNILVLGDIPEGAVLASEKNIIVLGKLLGTARAGDQTGTKITESLTALAQTETGHHVILAAHMKPQRLVIDGVSWEPEPIVEKRGGLFVKRSKDVNEIPSGAAYLADDQVVTQEINEESLQYVLAAAGLNL